jgi:hypothetical protein
MLIESEELRLIRSRSVVSRTIAGETLIVPVRGKIGDLASIYSFNATGSFIWQALNSPTTLRELISAAQIEFEVDPKQLRHDITQFLDELSTAGLVEICGPPLTAVQPDQSLVNESVTW